MKEWRKVVWCKSRVFLQIRLSELNFIGLKVGEKYEYKVKPKGKKLEISFRKAKEEKKGFKWLPIK